MNVECETCRWPLCQHGCCVNPVCPKQKDCEIGGCEMEWETVEEPSHEDE